VGWRKDPYHSVGGMHQKPARSDIIVLKQLLNFIPRGVLNQVAQKTGVEAKARTFSVLSHLATMLFAVWERLDLLRLLKSYGTASGRIRFAGALNQVWQQLWFSEMAPPRAQKTAPTV